jgi:hypothetical protein
MNSDTLFDIIVNLSIDDVIKLCSVNNHYIKICSRNLWVNYFNFHDKILPINII